jgi:rare lipoprotein A
VLAALGVGTGSCAPPASRTGTEGIRYVVGEPYALGRLWSYPREEYGLAESGLAAVLPDRVRGRRTADGEIHDPTALVAAHRTLQLPAVVRVWNLETGLEVRVRVNDRGPERPGRVIGLSRRAAELLGMAPGMPARVRIAVDPEASRAVAAGLPGAEGQSIAIAVAPVAVVERERLAPPPGARSAIGGAASPTPAWRSGLQPADALLGPRPSLRMPEEVVRRGPVPSRLVVDAGIFFRRDLAERRAAGIGGRVEPVGFGRSSQFRVRIAPFATVDEADQALESAFRRGIPDAKIELD